MSAVRVNYATLLQSGCKRLDPGKDILVVPYSNAAHVRKCYIKEIASVGSRGGGQDFDDGVDQDLAR